MTSSSLPRAGHPTDRLMGTSSAIATLRAQIRHLASFDTLGSPLVPTLLLQGETGTGKGLVARVVHDSGPRAAGPFIEVNCAAIPETMLEAELFGFEAGAFTDAKRAKPGLFEAASRGTLLLDEVDALPLALQGKLLTTLETKQVRRLGAVAARAVDVKLIAATNAVLPQHVATGRFRADLYHRLAVVVLALPPLRERGEDIRVLAQAYLQQYAAAHGVQPKRLSTEAEAWLQRYTWPGNVRELSHVMERVTLLHVGEEVDTETLTELCLPLTPSAASAEAAPAPQELAAERALSAEAAQVRQALAQTGGNVARAARMLGVSRDTVRYRMQRYGIARPRPVVPPAPEAAEPAPRLAPQRAPEVITPGSPPLPPDERGGGGPRMQPMPPGRRGEKEPQVSAGRQDTEREVAVERYTLVSGAAWEQKPVAVLALEVIWPEMSGLAPRRYDPWTAAARWERAIMDKIQGFGGLLLQSTAGLFLWVFGLPQALEQLPQRAVHSGLAIRQMVAAAEALDLGPCPVVRLSVHLGAVQVERPAQATPGQILAVGDTIARPVRLLGQAGPWELILSPEVGRLVEGWVALEARVGGYAVLGLGPGRTSLAPGGGQPRSPFLGRERELTVLDAVLEQVKAGQGQVVGLVGAPGMGKSRFLSELRPRLNAQGMAYREGQCLAYGSATPYLPVMDLVRDHCGITEGDRPDALTAKVRRALEPTGSDPELGLPLLLDLLGVSVEADRLAGLSAEARRARTFETLGQMFLASSQQQPLVLAVENLHWIDPTAEAFLALLIEQVAGVPLLVLTTARPGYRPPWGNRSYVTQLALPPLDSEASRQVIRSVLAHRPLAPALEQQLLAKAEGNPFFLEELAHTVREQEGRQLVLAVPDTIQAVLAARLDRLPAPEKRLVQAAAVIGKEVAVPLLQALVALPEATVQRGLARLQAAEFLFPRSFGPTPTYTFKHILTQEAVYQSVPGPTRREDHHQIAQALAEHFPALAATQPALLAHHYTEAGCTAPAIAAWQRAGQQAAERSAHVEAIAHFTQGLALLQDLPETPERAEQELMLHVALGTSLMITRGEEALEVEQTYSRAYALCQQVEDTAHLLPVLAGLQRFYMVRAAHQQALELGERLLSLAQRLQDQAFLLEAHGALSATRFILGQFGAALAHQDQVIAHYAPQPSHSVGISQDLKVSCLAGAARVLWCLGYPDQALARGQEAMAFAQRLAHPYSLVWSQQFVAELHQWRGELQAAQQGAEVSLTLATTQGFHSWTVRGTLIRGLIHASVGLIEEGIAQIQQGLEAMRTMGATRARAYFLTHLAEAYQHTGQPAVGLSCLTEALALIEETGERWWEAECHRLHGELLLVQASSRGTGPGALQQRAEAETCFCRAIAIARDQEAKSLELRAAMSLSRLWLRQGKRVEARQMLAEVYGWFTEGFDTADLQEARALLAELERG